MTIENPDSPEFHQNIRDFVSPYYRTRHLLCRFIEFILPPSEANLVANRLLGEFHHLTQIVNAEVENLLRVPGVSTKLVAYLQTNHEFFSMCLSENMEQRETLSSPDQVRTFLKEKLAWQNTEVIYGFFLDNQNKVIKHEPLFSGTVDSCMVYPREIVKKALLCGASNIIIAHNHPSGSQHPSQEDILITEKISKALELVNIRLHDHFIVTSSEIISLKEKGVNPWG